MPERGDIKVKKNKIHFLRKRFTFGIVTRERKLYVLQFSLKKPWWIPKCDKKYLKGNFTLFGWLFVYFGWLNHTYKQTE